MLQSSETQAQQVHATGGATQTASGTIITVGEPALLADIDGIIVSTSPLTITTTGAGGDGARATSRGQIDIASGSTIETSGNASAGARATSSWSLITIGTGTTITTHGNNSQGILAGTFGTVDANGVTVVTNGDGAFGVVANSASVTFINGAVTTSGTGAQGLRALTQGVLTADNVTVTTSGSDAAGLYASTDLIATSATVSTSGAGSHGVVLASGGEVTLTDSTVTTSGAIANIVHSTGPSTVTITNSSLSAADGAGFEVVSGQLTATLTNATITGGDKLLNVSDIGALNIYADSTTLTGSAVMAAGGTAQINLLGSSVWNITDDSNLTLLINQTGSLAQFSPPGSSAGPFKTLTVQDYVGIGGTLGVNTFLGTDGSPSDKLIIDGGSGLGSSLLSVTNVGGGGDLTTLDGILVVDAINGGTTVPGLLTLAGPVVVGPYEYSLYRGGQNGANPDNWYLRSVLDCALDPSAPLCAPDTPDWRQETSLYAAVPAMTLLYGRLMLDTLHERRGTAVSAYAEGAPNAAWARVIGQHGDRDGGKGGICGAGPKYDYDFWAFQGGMDLYRDGDVGTSRNHAGAFFAIGHGSGDVQHIGDGKAGENSFMAYSWGAYWTHYTPNNAYIDTLLMGSWYDIDAASNRIPKMQTDGGAFGASVEGGYPVYTGPGGFSIEPQAQLAYQTINLNNGSDVGAQVHFDNVNSLVVRVGVRFAQDFGTPTWLTGAPSTFTAWVRPNFWYEFLGDPKTKFSSATGFVPFAADMGGTTFEINTGFSTDIGGGAAIYANASYLVGLGERADGNAYDGKLGVKVAW
ncbi:autotransporter outer membrane beta-barrel domain-containing protein [Hyphomicrobium sp. D-2]|uniref:autotransporter family protein n=1 Tax=Hyphomicrobium sp. D-2 TaxID=3041621 RepID=UPI0024565305|nr:autotransporter outer membrane beta-barrel domain-containing protein [Hyphomicrobium sp. D-2]MDH4982783.1 autotransporter outer membrane beta-barrel domain-containing protein [Hyphomicrobium sp. D-2]